jgi:hypothetical protein
MIMGIFNGDNTGHSAGAGTTLRRKHSGYGYVAVYDSNGELTKGAAKSLIASRTGASDDWNSIAAIFSPASEAAPSVATAPDDGFITFE